MAPSKRPLFLSVPSARHGHLSALDGLRGLAVLIVLLSHMSNDGMRLWPGLDLSGTGKSGVYLFFVLSSFLLTRALLDRPWLDYRRLRPWADYALRRVLRIWPLYLVLLLLSAWITCAELLPWWHYRLGIPELIRHLQLQAGQSVLWSIPVEFKYYGVLPFVAIGFAWLHVRRVPWWGEALIVVAMLVAVCVVWPPSMADLNDIRLGPYLAIFLCGAYAAAAHKRLYDGGKAEVPVVWGGISILSLVALIITVPAVWSRLSDAPLDYTLNHRWFVSFGILWASLLLAVVNGPGWLRWLFASRPMRLLGVVSFSAYLWHMVVLDGLGALGMKEGVAAPLVFLAATLLISMGSYLLFERPWQNVYLRGPKS